MSDNQDALTVVALVISLIALCIAFFQMLQASFLTAEGGRRCKSAIMGKWFILTRWKFVFSEFRFEVRFTTPEIVLVDLHDDALHLMTPGHPIGDKTSRIFEASSQPQGRDVRRAGHLLQWDTLPYRIEHMWLNNTQKHALRDILRNFKTTPWRWIITWIMDVWRVGILQESDEDVMGDVDAMVSWDVFLRMNFLLQRYALELQTRATQTTQQTPLHLPDTTLRPHGTFVAVNLRQHTWDLMPPDVVRPLARSKLGTILVLASRIGMEWHELNIEERKFRAEGVHGASGCTLSSRTIHGLGLVLEFNASRIGRPSLMSPCKYADMMFHGRIPGSPKLKIPEASLTGDFRKTNHHWWYRQLRLSDEIPRVQRERPWWGRITLNDMLALLCPFLPPKDSPLTYFPYPVPKRPEEGMNDNHMYVSMFRHWESRKVFLLSLSKVKDEPRFASMGNLKTAFEDLKYLEEYFEKDFYDFHRSVKRGDRLYFPPDPMSYVTGDEETKTKVETEGLDARDVVILNNKLREIHARTTRYFEALLGTASDSGDYQNGEDSNPYLEKKNKTSFISLVDYNIPEAPTGSQRRCLSYLDLVRAYIEILAPTILGEHHQLKHMDENLIRRARQEAGGEAMPMGDKNPASIMELMIEQIPNIISKLRDPKHCRDGALGMTDDQVEEAWWIMMVRGISWNMSVFWKLIPYEKMIPSSLYDSQVPVWIT